MGSDPHEWEGWVEPSLDPPYLPVEVSAVELAFPAHALRLMPRREDIPEVDHGWAELAHDVFMGQADDLQLLPSVFLVITHGSNSELAWRHLRCILGSYEPKHEHKMEAVAYLLSLWFRHAAWLDGAPHMKDKSKTVRERKVGNPDLPEGYDEEV